MYVQKSFEDREKGSLYIVPTPIGNLDDITFRALNVLKEATLIAAEDTRNTKKLLNHFDIKTPLISYHEHNKQHRTLEIVQKVANGDMIALVSDAGMPAISDPGYELIQALIAKDYPVIVLPGANAALCALIGSGLPTQEFLFYGFLPRKKQEKNQELERLRSNTATMIFYESPHRISATVQSIFDVLGDRQMAIARELSKLHEEYVRGTSSEVLAWLADHQPRGEYCIVVQGHEETEAEKNQLWWSRFSVKEHVDYLIENNQLSSKEAIKQVAEERQLPRREVYELYHIK